MKRILLAFSFAAFALVAFGQDNPVTWSYSAAKKTADTYDITITANVDEPWHIYSMNTGKGGPVPTNIVFKTNPLVTKMGAIKEVGKVEKVFDKNFNTNVLSYSNKVQFVQTVKVKGGAKTNMAGTIEYMVCDDSHCLPPTKKSFDLKLQ